MDNRVKNYAGLRSWLIYDEDGAKRNADYIEMHRELAERFHLSLHLVMDHDVSGLLKQSDKLPDFCFVRTIQPKMNKQLEDKGIVVYNSSFVSEICNDKGKTIQYVKKCTHVPVISTSCYKRNQLSQKLLEQYPDHVIKAVDGHGGKQVFLTSESFSDIEQAMEKSDFIIQPRIRGKGQDIRVYVIGTKIMGAVIRTAKNGFKSNFSLGGEVQPYTLKEKDKKMIQEILSAFSFGMAGIDFIVDNDENLIFNEIEDVVGARMFYQCYPNINLLEEYFRFVLELHCK